MAPQNTGFHEMTDAAFGHDRYGYGFLNAAYHPRIAHAGNAAGGPSICRDPFQAAMTRRRLPPGQYGPVPVW